MTTKEVKIYMTDVLRRYGIKEVADGTFYAIDKESGDPSYPVLYLDTLKVFYL